MNEEKLEEFSFTSKDFLKKDLVCNICSKLLNVAPIVFSESIGNICGRCSPSVTREGFGSILRQNTFEILIRYLTYPCSNKEYGCTDILRFSEVKDHEKFCRFQHTSCPLSYKQLFNNKTCSWGGNIKELTDHLATHTDDFLETPYLEWPEGESVIFFTHVGNARDNVIATVVIKYEDKSKYYCAVMINGTDLECQCFRYQLELFDEHKNKSVILRMRNRLEPLSEFPDNLRYPENVLEVDLESIDQMLQNPNKISAKFGIVKKNKKDIFQITGRKDVELVKRANVETTPEKYHPPDEEMLAELECPVCNEYMVPPIYICATGHSVCSDCHTRVERCPSCRSVFAKGRNYTLEKLTLKVKYPCKNSHIGCGFVTTSDKIKNHESLCELSENPCILSCGWKGLSTGMYSHFLERHVDQLVEHNTPIFLDINNLDRRPYFLYCFGEMFCFICRNGAKNSLKYSFQHVGHLDAEPKYKYSIQFASAPDAQCPNFVLTNFFQPWINNFNEASIYNFVLVPDELLKNHMSHNHLFYIKINVTPAFN